MSALTTNKDKQARKKLNIKETKFYFWDLQWQRELFWKNQFEIQHPEHENNSQYFH